MQEYNEEILNILNKLRTEYVSNKLSDDKNNSKKSFEVEVYERFVNIFGEEVMLNLDSSNISDFEEKLSSEYLYSFEKLYKRLDGAFNQKEDELSSEFGELGEDSDFMKFINDIESNLPKSDLMDCLDTIEENKKKVEMKKLSIKRQDEEKDNFRELLEKCGFISKENIAIMMNNLNISLTNGVEVVEVVNEQRKFVAGCYRCIDKKISISISADSTRPDVITHEMLHAASTVFDEQWNNRRVGTKVLVGEKCMGSALNEGITEYYTRKLMGGKIYGNGYGSLVAVAKDLAQLYGDENIFDAYLNDPRKLEVLMEKDGKNYMEFTEMFDAHYINAYRKKTSTQETLKAGYEEIGQFIEEIKEKRQMENPGINLPESEWKKVLGRSEITKNDDVLDVKQESEKSNEKENNEISYIKQENEKIEEKSNSNIGMWFKNIVSKIKKRFFSKEKQLLLESGEQKIDFRNSLKTENFKTEFDMPTIEQENTKREKQSSIDLEK